MVIYAFAKFKNFKTTFSLQNLRHEKHFEGK